MFNSFEKQIIKNSIKDYEILAIFTNSIEASCYHLFINFNGIIFSVAVSCTDLCQMPTGGYQYVHNGVEEFVSKCNKIIPVELKYVSYFDPLDLIVHNNFESMGKFIFRNIVHTVSLLEEFEVFTEDYCEDTFCSLESRATELLQKSKTPAEVFNILLSEINLDLKRTLMYIK